MYVLLEAFYFGGKQQRCMRCIWWHQARDMRLGAINEFVSATNLFLMQHWDLLLQLSVQKGV